MNSRNLFLYCVGYVMLLVILLGGCAVPQGPDGVVPQQGPDRVLLTQEKQVTALVKEQEKDYLSAYLYWQQALRLIEKKLASLDVNMKEISLLHAEMGVAFYNNKDSDLAVGSFLQALRYDPTNEKALRYLTEKFEAESVIPTTVVEHDTFAAISQRAYGSADNAYLVPIFTRIGSEDELPVGGVLQLPQIDSFFSPDLHDYKRDLLKARRLYREKQYRELLPIAEKLRADMRDDQEASFLVNSAHVALGRMMQDQGNYQEALYHFKSVDPIFRDMREEITSVESLKKNKLATEKKGAYERLMQQVHDMYKKQQYHEVLALLQKFDHPTEESQRMQAQVRRAMHERAGIHYKRGVSFFIEDRLDKAISEWKQALYYDPVHQKAQDNIEKARKLLEKVNAIK